MSKRFFAAVLGAGALAVSALTAGLPGADAATPQLSHFSNLHAQRVCAATPAAGHATCFAKVMVNKKGEIPNATGPLGTALNPTQLRSAYNLNGTSGAGRTVAIVDAYGYPNLASDLATFRSQYGLPACGSGCLTIVNQTGGTTPPAANLGWAQEQALDVDAVSAACPDCKILVVQANSSSLADLGTAVNQAAKTPGVVAISNSYGGGDSAESSAYNHPGIAITASTGDNGYKGGSYPASSAFVTAVGGTSLKMSGNTRVTETAWSGAGSGCSTVIAKPTFQNSVNTGCAKRAIADVSAAADPNTGGLSVYAPTSLTASAWSQYGGTSESSPIIASVYALAGNTGAGVSGYANAIPYAHTASLNDITSGSNSKRKCPATQWCVAGAGWDGPTGLGTPNGTGAF
ncbi:S53 family peptidase [Nocardioides cynanchi]|uniref:S53 family peptidase n=1 Tax=Nocardioides cynanchi TaxID=2558918 RepID=UPI001245455F|nr:S53 family peptidase [Nocardioides cynanchi]